MPNIGPTELIIVLVVVLLLFGTTRLPKLARSMGEASKEFKKGIADAGKSDEAKEAAAEAKADADEKVTMTKAELDALLAEREAQAKAEKNSTPPST